MSNKFLLKSGCVEKHPAPPMKPVMLPENLCDMCNIVNTFVIVGGGEGGTTRIRNAMLKMEGY